MVRNAKGRRFEGMRRVASAIWSGYQCGYQRFGVGIGVCLTSMVYLQWQAKASPLSLIGNG